MFNYTTNLPLPHYSNQSLTVVTQIVNNLPKNNGLYTFTISTIHCSKGQSLDNSTEEQQNPAQSLV